MKLLKKILHRLRHNLFVYMMWDVPLSRANSPEEKRKIITKLNIRLALIFGLLYWINSFYDIRMPPAYEDLHITTGILEAVHRKSGRGGSAKRIVIRDYEGNNLVIPTFVGHLSITPNRTSELKRSCVGREITVRWFDEPLIFVGHVRDAWEMETCDPSIRIDYQWKADQRKLELESNRKVFGVSLLVLFFMIFPFALNFIRAIKLLRESPPPLYTTRRLTWLLRVFQKSR